MEVENSRTESLVAGLIYDVLETGKFRPHNFLRFEETQKKIEACNWKVLAAERCCNCKTPNNRLKQRNATTKAVDEQEVTKWDCYLLVHDGFCVNGDCRAVVNGYLMEISK